MFCAFEGPPKVLRLYGHGEVLGPEDAEFMALRPLFPAEPLARAIVVMTVRRIADSCGFGVPLYQFKGQRSQLADWADRKGTAGLVDYQLQKNATSIDGLPAVTWLSPPGAAKPSTG